MNTNQYHEHAEAFLAKYGIKCRITLSNTKPAPWSDESEGERNHYRVTLSKKGEVTRGSFGHPIASRLTFDFWGSINDAAKNVDPVAYDVLACIGGDANTPETFTEFCGNYGYDADSISALQTFRRCSAFGKRLRAFFTADELEALGEIN